MATKVVILPGLDGSSALLSPFVQAAPAWASAVVLDLPCLEVDSYDQLADCIEPAVREEGPAVLIGESFSGPLAVLLAARLGQAASLLVLCNSFVTKPRGALWYLPWPLLSAIRPPAGLVSRWMTGGDRGMADRLTAELGKVPVGVRAHRYQLLLRVDVREAFRELGCHVLLIRGAKDRIVGASKLKEMRALRPSVAVETLPAPHLTFQTRPEQAWQIITRHAAPTPGA